MSGSKPAEVRFYCNADLLGLAHVLAKLRADVTYPGDHGVNPVQKRQRLHCSITDTAVKDDVWTPEVARRGWPILTRDRRIQGTAPLRSPRCETSAPGWWLSPAKRPAMSSRNSKT